MPQITEHFSEAELDVQNADQRVKDNAKEICDLVLEKIHDKFGRLYVTNGERCEAHNHEVGGKPTSFHLYTDGKSAVDFRPLDAALTTVFTWMCLESGLPFDKVIMEYNKQNEPDILHVQYDSANPPRRQGFIGYTGDCKRYTPVEVRSPIQKEEGAANA